MKTYKRSELDNMLISGFNIVLKDLNLEYFSVLDWNEVNISKLFGNRIIYFCESLLYVPDVSVKKPQYFIAPSSHTEIRLFANEVEARLFLLEFVEEELNKKNLIID